MESGSAAPAPILHKSEKGYDVLDGIQRLSAGQMHGSPTLAAYIVTCDSEDTLTAIRVLANARLQGRPEPPDWTRRQAVNVLVIDRGMSVEEVARMGGWRVSEIERLKKVLEWGFQIRCIGGPNLPDNVIDTISKHTSMESLAVAPQPIADFCHTLKTAKFSNADAEPFVESFFKPVTKISKAHGIYEERLDKFKDDPEVQIRISGRRSPRQKDDALLRRTLKSAETIAARIADEGVEVPFVDEFFHLLNAVAKHLKVVAPRHQQPTTAATPADMWSDK